MRSLLRAAKQFALAVVVIGALSAWRLKHNGEIEEDETWT